MFWELTKSMNLGYCWDWLTLHQRHYPQSVIDKGNHFSVQGFDLIENIASDTFNKLFESQSFQNLSLFDFCIWRQLCSTSSRTATGRHNWIIVMEIVSIVWNSILGLTPLSLVISSCAVVIGFLYYHSRRPHGFPPGPPALPWVGSIPFAMSDNYIEDYMKLREKYGPINSLKLGKR